MRSALDDVLRSTVRVPYEGQIWVADSRNEDIAFGLVPLSEDLGRRYRFFGPFR